MENNTMLFCQSCGMPMSKDEDFGTQVDGSRNQDYCTYCYKDGSFTNDQTLDEMIESCLPFVSKGEPWPDESTARSEMQKLFPQLKRWKK